MRKLFPLLAMAGLVLSTAAIVQAAEDKVIEGTAECAKCTRKETKSCQAAVKVKEGDKEVVYYLVQNDVAKKFHEKICPPNSAEKVKVSGTLTEKDGKKILDPKEITVVEG